MKAPRVQLMATCLADAYFDDVARATVYYQFRSKAGLLEALFDSLGASGGKLTATLTALPNAMSSIRTSPTCPAKCRRRVSASCERVEK